MHGGIDLSGEWSGEFSYPAHAGPTTPFVARLVDVGGRLSGSIIEPHWETGATIEARVDGLRQGASVDFTKTYAPGVASYDTPVDYVGQVSADGNVVSGVWSLLAFDGRFEMRRDGAVEEVRAVEVGVEVPVE